MGAKIVLCIIFGYLLGSLNTSLIVGRLMYNKDVRDFGSGNAGATNTLRTLGKRAAFIVVLGDALKGIVSCIIGYSLVGEMTEYGYVGLYMAGLASVIGHNWPVYFRFKGGKGVMTTFAVIAYMDANTALILLGVFLVTVSLTKYVSLGSVLAAVVFPILTICYNRPVMLIYTSIALAVLVIFRHYANIGRLINGTEKKLSFGKKISR